MSQELSADIKVKHVLLMKDLQAARTTNRTRYQKSEPLLSSKVPNRSRDTSIFIPGNLQSHLTENNTSSIYEHLPHIEGSAHKGIQPNQYGLMKVISTPFLFQRIPQKSSNGAAKKFGSEKKVVPIGGVTSIYTKRIRFSNIQPTTKRISSDREVYFEGLKSERKMIPVDEFKFSRTFFGMETAKHAQELKLEDSFEQFPKLAPQNNRALQITEMFPHTYQSTLTSDPLISERYTQQKNDLREKLSKQIGRNRQRAIGNNYAQTAQNPYETMEKQNADDGNFSAWSGSSCGDIGDKMSSKLVIKQGFSLRKNAFSRPRERPHLNKQMLQLAKMSPKPQKPSEKPEESIFTIPLWDQQKKEKALEKLKERLFKMKEKRVKSFQRSLSSMRATLTDQNLNLEQDHIERAGQCIERLEDKLQRQVSNLRLDNPYF
ncbi:hypothetical protein FGO68_gene11571 [Halteria grandinella]|uniref:Enkurin domain-containing protein n=1 Tax=Halteria grandinella TaxID=5974 RepID=A0A8J8NQ29_HALGN|nr:hypothetical protein FGO68_gene11571 [Halteria grandinella]